MNNPYCEIHSRTMLRTEDIRDMIQKLSDKRHSRVWFGADVELLNALCEAELKLHTVASLLVVEGKK